MGQWFAFGKCWCVQTERFYVASTEKGIFQILLYLRKLGVVFLWLSLTFICVCVWVCIHTYIQRRHSCQVGLKFFSNSHSYSGEREESHQIPLWSRHHKVSSSFFANCPSKIFKNGLLQSALFFIGSNFLPLKRYIFIYFPLKIRVQRNIWKVARNLCNIG